VSKFVHDPTLYESLREPFDEAEVDVAVNGFVEAVLAARKQFGIPELALAVSVRVRRADGKVEDRASCAYRGSSEREPFIWAWALGRCEARFAEALDEHRARARNLEVPRD